MTSIRGLAILVVAAVFGIADAANAQPCQKLPLVVGIASVIDGADRLVRDDQIGPPVAVGS